MSKRGKSTLVLVPNFQQHTIRPACDQKRESQEKQTDIQRTSNMFKAYLNLTNWVDGGSEECRHSVEQGTSCLVERIIQVKRDWRSWWWFIDHLMYIPGLLPWHCHGDRSWQCQESTFAAEHVQRFLVSAGGGNKTVCNQEVMYLYLGASM